MHERRWVDPRDGREWLITHNPGVELARPGERSFRHRMIFTSGAIEVHAPAVFGTDLGTLSDQDLIGLLDQARASEEAG